MFDGWMLVWAERSTYSVPLPIVAPQLVLDDSVVAQRHLDLAVGQVESQQRDGSAAAYVEDQPFGRLGVDVEGEVGPDKFTRQRQVGETGCICVSPNVLVGYVSVNTAGKFSLLYFFFFFISS